MLKQRTPEHVAKKLLAMWLALYGASELPVADHGDEFEGAFIGTCEEHGVDVRVVGARALCKHGFAERIGGILGTM